RRHPGDHRLSRVSALLRSGPHGRGSQRIRMTTTLSPHTLVGYGTRVIAEGQAPSGAYIASPNFPQYNFAWLRDGAYCALAMDAVGERPSAEAFHAWVARVVEGQAPRIRSVIDRLREGETPGV